MKNKLSHLPCYIVVSSIHLGIIILLPGCFALLPDIAFADNTPTDNTQHDEVKPVEIGVGGNIKLEKAYRSQAENLFDWHAQLLWESRYVTEGRDNLSGSNLASLSSEFTLGELTIVPWLANSAAADYTELNLNVVYGFEAADDLIVYAGYTNLQVRDSGARSNDNEISVDVAYSGLENLTLTASVYHSHDAKGSFIELSAKYQYLSSENLHLGLQGVLGANAEYIPDGHNGLNHFQLQANAAYHPLDRIEIYAYAGYNVAINRDITRYVDDELLDDFFWAGVGCAYRF